MSRVPDLLVERLALGELSPERAAEVRRRLEAAGEGHLPDELAASNAEILARYPTPPRPRPAPVRAAVRWAPVLALAALALFAVRPSPPVEPPALEQATAKGPPLLRVFVETDGAPRPLVDGARAAPGDRLQVVVNAAGAPWAAVLSLDGRGAITRHFAGPVEPGAHALPSSFSLDDAPGFERFLLVAGDAPVDLAGIEGALRAAGEAGAPALPPGLRASSILLVKD